MTEWIVSVFSTVLIVAIISVVLPEGKLFGFVKPFISLIVVLIIVAPIVNADGITESFTATDSAVETDGNFLEYVALSKIDFYCENCIKIAENNGINGCEIKIQYTVDEDGALKIHGAKINLQNAVITSDSEHIVILQTVKRQICAYLNVEETGATFYE